MAAMSSSRMTGGRVGTKNELRWTDVLFRERCWLLDSMPLSLRLSSMDTCMRPVSIDSNAARHWESGVEDTLYCRQAWLLPLKEQCCGLLKVA